MSIAVEEARNALRDIGASNIRVDEEDWYDYPKQGRPIYRGIRLTATGDVKEPPDILLQTEKQK